MSTSVNELGPCSVLFESNWLLGALLPSSPCVVCQGLCTVLDKEAAFGIVSLKTSLLRRELLKVVCKKCCSGRYKQSPREEHVLSTSLCWKEFHLRFTVLQVKCVNLPFWKPRMNYGRRKPNCFGQWLAHLCTTWQNKHLSGLYTAFLSSSSLMVME